MESPQPTGPAPGPLPNPSQSAPSAPVRPAPVPAPSVPGFGPKAAEKPDEPAWLDGMKDARVDSTRHPLRGIQVGADEPPEHWNHDMRMALHQPRERAWVTPEDVRGLVSREGWSSLRYHVHVEERDLADLRYYRMRAGWRLVRMALRAGKKLADGQMLCELDLEDLVSALPPTLPADANGHYDPMADEALTDYLTGMIALAQRSLMYHGSKEDAQLGTYQMRGLDSPHFARAAWPTVVELLLTERAMAEELVAESHDRTAIGFQSYLASNIGALMPHETDDLTQFRDNQLRDAYDVDDNTARARVLGKVDDLRRQAKDEYSLVGQATALKMEMVAYGIGRQFEKSELADLFNAMNKGVLDIQGGVAAIGDDHEDPLELEGD